MTEQDYRDAIAGVLPDANVLSEYVFHNVVVEGDVISVDPEAGTLVPPDATITLLVSLGSFPTQESRWTGAQHPVSGVPLNEIEADNPRVMMVVFVHLDIPGDPVRVHTGVPTLKWDDDDDGVDEVWLGVGQLGGIDAVSESLEVIAQPIKLSLSGVETNLIADMMSTVYHGADVNIYVGLLDPDTYNFIDLPEEVWSGFIDVMWVDIDGDQSVIRVDCEHRLRRQPSTSRYTDEEQRSFDATDRFFDKLHLIPGFRGTWGARDTGFGNVGGGGRHGGGRGIIREH